MMSRVSGGDRPAQSKKERIAKVLARAGVASRRECERLIEAGRVCVNGARLSHPAVLVDAHDAIVIDGALDSAGMISWQKFISAADAEKIRGYVASEAARAQKP